MVWTYKKNGRAHIGKKIIGNENEWKMSQGQTTHMKDRPSQERYREQRMRLEDSRLNARISRLRQLETLMQNSTHKCGNNIREMKINGSRQNKIPNQNFKLLY